FSSYLYATQYPGAMLIAQWTPTDVAAWLRGGAINTLTIPQIQALATGPITIVVNGLSYTNASISLAAATSYTSAAGLIQTALNTTLPAGGVSAATGGSIVSTTSTFTGSIAGNVLNVTTVPTNTLVRGAIITVGASAGTQIMGQLSGTTGGIGTYAVSTYQSVASIAMTTTYGLMTLVGANGSGTFSVGMQLTGTGVTAGTEIMQLGTGVGAAGTYYVSPAQAITSQTITGTGYPLTVTYDSLSGGILITSGTQGALATVAYATGTLAAALNLTSAGGGTLSQGASGQTPQTFMPTVVATTQNWASFFTLYDPDDSLAASGFWAWTTAQNNRYLYLGWDTDIQPTITAPCTTCFAYNIGPLGTGVGGNSSGTVSIYDPSNLGKAAFVAGYIASINFGQTNGRTTAAFRQQSGVIADVSTLASYTNLLANGY